MSLCHVLSLISYIALALDTFQNLTGDDRPSTGPREMHHHTTLTCTRDTEGPAYI